MKDTWEQDASTPVDYHCVEARRGREFVLRMTTGADVWLATQRFAIDQGIRFAKLHAAFMGGFQPARFLVWSPDTRDSANWPSGRVCQSPAERPAARSLGPKHRTPAADAALPQRGGRGSASVTLTG